MGALTLRPVILGVLTIITVLIITSFILSLLLQFTTLQEQSLGWFILPFTLFTLLIGGVVSGYRSGHKGWYFGGLTGMCFILITWLISFLGYNAAVTLNTLLMYVGYLAIAIIGGIIGVNMSPQRGSHS